MTMAATAALRNALVIVRAVAMIVTAEPPASGMAALTWSTKRFRPGPPLASGLGVT